MSGVRSGRGYLTNHETPINSQQYHNAVRRLRQSLVPNVCRANILDKLKQLDLTFIKNDAKPTTLKITPNLKHVIDHHLSSFVLDCVDEIFTLGIVPVKYKYADDFFNTGADEEGVFSNSSATGRSSKVMVPYVIKPSLGIFYDITVRPNFRKMDQSVFCFYWLTDEHGNPIQPEYDPNVKIFSSFGFDPALDGSLTSIGHMIHFYEGMNDHIASLSLRGVRLKNEDRVVIESAQETQLQMENKIAHYVNIAPNSASTEGTYVMRPDEMNTTGPNETDVENKNIRQQFQQSNQSNKTGIMMNNENSSVFAKESIEEIVNKSTSVITLPPGRRVATNNHQGHGNSVDDWIQINNAYSRLICAAFRVPHHVIFPEAQRSMQDASSMVKNDFDQTIDGWKLHIERILESIFNDLYASDHILEDIQRIIESEYEKYNESDQKMLDDYVTKNMGVVTGSVRFERDNPYLVQTLKDVVRSVRTKNKRSKSSTNEDEKKDHRTVFHTEEVPNPKVEVTSIERSYNEVKRKENTELGHERDDTSLKNDKQRKQQNEQIVSDFFENIHGKSSKIVSVRVKFSNNPNMSDGQILLRYAIGAITWIECTRFLRLPLKLPTDADSAASTKDPWHQAFKLGILQKNQSTELTQLGPVAQAIFSSAGIQTGDEKDEKDKHTKKRKQTNSDEDDGGASKKDSESKKQKKEAKTKTAQEEKENERTAEKKKKNAENKQKQ